MPRLLTLFVVTIISISLVAAAGTSQVVAARQNSSFQVPSAGNPDAALNFMLGSWRVSGRALQRDGTYSADTFSTLDVTPLFSGGNTMGIQLHGYPLKDEDGGASPFGITYFEYFRMFVYHAETKSWRGIGHNTLGNRKWLEGHVSGDTFYFDQTGELFQKAEGTVRFTFYDITENSHRVQIDYTTDGGKSWVEGTYRMDVVRTQ